MQNQVIIPRILDGHVHWRKGSLRYNVVPHTVRCCGGAIIMPNTEPPILTDQDLVTDLGLISNILKVQGAKHFTPYLTIQITSDTTSNTILKARLAGAIGGKVYPEGVTNSEYGLSSFRDRKTVNVFHAMQEVGMPLLVHGEYKVVGNNDINREYHFLPTLYWLTDAFPDLKIVLEHVSTRIGVETVRKLGENVGATITPMHLIWTYRDINNSDRRIRPLPSSIIDRDALIEAATSGCPNFFAGSDSAPHSKPRDGIQTKWGSFSAPVFAAVVAREFAKVGKLDRLGDFMSRFGPAFYGLEPSKENITLIKQDWVVPSIIGTVVPLCAGETLPWKLLQSET